jgi:hypothetical protein
MEMNYEYLIDEMLERENMADKIIVIRGELNWAKVTGDAVPYTGNPKYDKGPYWAVDVTPDAASRKLMAQNGIDGKLREPKENDFRKESFISLRHLLKRPDGTINKPITIKAGDGRPWDGSKIGNGSMGDVMVKVKDYGSGSDKGTYIQAIRVLRHVPYEGADFAPLSEDDEFFGAGGPEDPSAPEPNSTGHSQSIDDLDDDAPF